MIASDPPKELSSPSVNSIMKNIKAQKTDPGIVAIAAG